MIVTLAGHVDHGKTSLVQALTGVNTDRLEEERRRGLTIDLGFAYLKTPDCTLGFVDVPGHHRFIHNMVASVSSEQHALLVIAADDGPMPQSREHLQILNLLGIDSGIIALTKCDRVGSDRRAAVRQEIASLVQNTCLANAEIVETSTATGEGIDALKESLLAAARQDREARTEGSFRMPIDRAFSVAGAGVVVTGTIHDGTVAGGDALTLYPEGTSVRVKSVRAQDADTASASVGDRCALNLAGVEVSEVRRGQWLSAENAQASGAFSLELTVLADFPRSVRHWLPVHVYHATTHTTGHVALLTDNRVAPGATELVELITRDPLLLRRGDRLVLRDQGLDRTLGGGSVDAPRPASGRRRAEDRLRRLVADALGDPAAALRSHLDIGAVAIAPFRENHGLTEAEMSALLHEESCEVIDGHAVRGQVWSEWQRAFKDEIEQRHRADPALQGLKQSELDTARAQPFAELLLRSLVAGDELTVRAGRYLPAAHRVALSDAEEKLLARVKPLIDRTQPDSLGDMAKRFRLGTGDLARSLHPLVAKHYLVRISDTRYYLPEYLTTLAELAATLHEGGPFTVRQFRDAASIGRNVAIEVLEHFDRIGYTRRDGDTRRVIGNYESPR